MRLSLHEKRRDHFRHAFCLFNCLTSTRLNKRFFCFEYGEGSKISDYYKFAFSDEIFFFCIGEDCVKLVEGNFFAHDTVHGYCFICQKVYCRRKTTVARVTAVISDYYKFAFSDEIFFFCVGEDCVKLVEGNFFAHDTVHGYCFICQKVYCRRKTTVARVTAVISDYYKFAFSDEIFFFCIGEDCVKLVEGNFFAHDTVHGYCFICQKVYCRRKTTVARVDGIYIRLL